MTATIAPTAAGTAAVHEGPLSVTTVPCDVWGDRECVGVVEVDGHGLYRVWADGDRAGLMPFDPETDGDRSCLGRIGHSVRRDWWMADDEGEPVCLGWWLDSQDVLVVDGRGYRLTWTVRRDLPRLSLL